MTKSEKAPRLQNLEPAELETCTYMILQKPTKKITQILEQQITKAKTKQHLAETHARKHTAIKCTSNYIDQISHNAKRMVKRKPKPKNMHKYKLSTKIQNNQRMQNTQTIPLSQSKQKHISK